MSSKPKVNFIVFNNQLHYCTLFACTQCGDLISFHLLELFITHESNLFSNLWIAMRSDTGYARLQTVTSFNMATFSSSSNNGMTALWRQRLRPWPPRYPTF